MQDDQIIQLEDVQSAMPQSAPQQDIAMPEEPVVQAQPQQQAPVETEQARNFRQLKDSKEREERDRKRAERERDEAIAYIKEMQSRQNQGVPKNLDDDISNSADEDLAEMRKVKKVDRRVAELESRLEKYEKQSASSLAETRLKSLHADADAVLSKDNIAQFSEKYPEMANTIFHSAGDDYSKMLSAYTMIKQLGVHQDARPDLYSADRDLAQRNAAKPRPLTSIAPQQGDSPMSRANAFANGLTPELQKQLLKEMAEARKGSM